MTGRFQDLNLCSSCTALARYKMTLCDPCLAKAQNEKMREALELVAIQNSDLPFIEQARECLREIEEMGK